MELTALVVSTPSPPLKIRSSGKILRLGSLESIRQPTVQYLDVFFLRESIVSPLSFGLYRVPEMKKKKSKKRGFYVCIFPLEGTEMGKWCLRLNISMQVLNSQTYLTSQKHVVLNGGVLCQLSINDRSIAYNPHPNPKTLILT
jgi:hypothetical protein